MTTVQPVPFTGASPAQIREAILPEDQSKFDRQWRAALDVAADALSLDEVHETLESWRRVAWLVTAHGPEGYRRMMATAEQTLRTGQSPPGSVSWEQVKNRLGLQVAYRVELYSEAEEQISTLPATALPALAEAMVMVELTPWNGAPLYRDKPSGQVRTLPFGAAGMVTYLIAEYDQKVCVISVVWAG